MQRPPQCILAISLAVLLPALSPQVSLRTVQADELLLRDGRKLTGSVHEDGDRLRVDNRWGSLWVPLENVVSLTREAGLDAQAVEALRRANRERLERVGQEHRARDDRRRAEGQVRFLGRWMPKEQRDSLLAHIVEQAEVRARAKRAEREERRARAREEEERRLAEARRRQTIARVRAYGRTRRSGEPVSGTRTLLPWIVWPGDWPDTRAVALWLYARERALRSGQRIPQPPFPPCDPPRRHR